MELSKSTICHLTNTFESELLPSLGSSAIGDNSIRELVRKSTSELIEKCSSLERILERVLEYDPSAYKVIISGFPSLFDEDRKPNMGYTITVEVKPLPFPTRHENTRIDFD